MASLILLRHGQSTWNLENRFTGWVDVDLTEKGRKEGIAAGRLLKEKNIQVDLAYTSVLTRAIRTLWVALDEMDAMWVPVTRSWLLNERHYGGLTGLNKAETAAKHGDEQVHIWRRSYDIPPPDMDEADEHNPNNDRRYFDVPAEQMPLTESLFTTLQRVLPYWDAEIAPQIKAGKNVIISAHGNSLRALVKHLKNIPNDEITSLNIPNGIPWKFELDENLNVLEDGYLVTEDEFEQATANVE